MPRNEFQAGDREEPSDEEWMMGGFQLEIGRDDDGIPFIRKVYPGKGSEDPSQESEPVEAAPEQKAATPSLADLRKSGESTTNAHRNAGPAT